MGGGASTKLAATCLFSVLGCFVSATVIYTIVTDGLPFRLQLLTPSVHTLTSLFNLVIIKILIHWFIFAGGWLQLWLIFTSMSLQLLYESKTNYQSWSSLVCSFDPQIVFILFRLGWCTRKTVLFSTWYGSFSWFAWAGTQLISSYCSVFFLLLFNNC